MTKQWSSTAPETSLPQATGCGTIMLLAILLLGLFGIVLCKH